MDMRQIEELYTKVTQYAPGCSEPMAVEHLRQAAITFAKRTRCWRFHDRFETVPCEPDFICTPPYAALFQVERVTFDGRELEPAEYNSRGHEHAEGFPQYYRQTSPNTLKLEPYQTGVISISMFLHPAVDADVLPSILIDNFARDIADGALATLLMLPGMPFTNPQLAAMFSQKFEAALDNNFDYNVRGQNRGKIRSRSNF